MKALVNFTAGVAFIALFFGVAYLADRDLQAATQIGAIDQQTRATEKRMQRAARALCASEMGPGAQALWTQDGDLVCRAAVLTAEVTQ